MYVWCMFMLIPLVKWKNYNCVCTPILKENIKYLGLPRTVGSTAKSSYQGEWQGLHKSRADVSMCFWPDAASAYLIFPWLSHAVLWNCSRWSLRAGHTTCGHKRKSEIDFFLWNHLSGFICGDVRQHLSHWTLSTWTVATVDLLEYSTLVGICRRGI